MEDYLCSRHCSITTEWQLFGKKAIAGSECSWMAFNNVIHSGVLAAALNGVETNLSCHYMQNVAPFWHFVNQPEIQYRICHVMLWACVCRNSKLNHYGRIQKPNHCGFLIGPFSDPLVIAVYSQLMAVLKPFNVISGVH